MKQKQLKMLESGPGPMQWEIEIFRFNYYIYES